MATKERTDKAALESLEHWEGNVEIFDSAYDKERWFKLNCQIADCALCGLFWWASCGGCPLNDPSYSCCKEWHDANMANKKSGLDLYHIEAVRDRIKRECEKRGLL